MNGKLRFGVLGALAGGVLAWLNKPAPNWSHYGAVNPDAAYQATLFGHIAMFAAIGAVVGIVLSILMATLDKPRKEQDE